MSSLCITNFDKIKHLNIYSIDNIYEIKIIQRICMKIMCCSSSRCGSANDWTIHWLDRCILFFHFGPSHSGLYRDCNLLEYWFWTRKLGGSEECNYMRYRPDGAIIWITQCNNGHNEIVYLIKKKISIFI